MTALGKLLSPKKKAGPRPVQWIKLNRRRIYHRLVIPPCFVCGSETAEVVWFNCKTGGVRCLGCRDDTEPVRP
jgi:hypothetical protein